MDGHAALCMGVVEVMSGSAPDAAIEVCSYSGTSYRCLFRSFLQLRLDLPGDMPLPRAVMYLLGLDYRTSIRCLTQAPLP